MSGVIVPLKIHSRKNPKLCKLFNEIPMIRNSIKSDACEVSTMKKSYNKD